MYWQLRCLDLWFWQEICNYWQTPILLRFSHSWT